MADVDPDGDVRRSRSSVGPWLRLEKRGGQDWEGLAMRERTLHLQYLVFVSLAQPPLQAAEPINIHAVTE